MLSHKRVRADLESMLFNDFYGVIVYQRPGFKTRLAVGAVDEEEFNFLVKYNEALPLTSRPSEAWRDSVQVGKVSNMPGHDRTISRSTWHVEEVMNLMFPSRQEVKP